MKIYGLTEIAEELGVPANTVTQWRFRGKLPPPTEELSFGPVWLEADIRAWIREERRRLKAPA